MRLFFPVILILLAFGWAIYELLFKKNKEQAKGIISFTVFFGIIWGLIYYWILK
jgi:hypothetical protein